MVERETDHPKETLNSHRLVFASTVRFELTGLEGRIFYKVYAEEVVRKKMQLMRYVENTHGLDFFSSCEKSGSC